MPNHQDADHEAKITNPIDGKCLFSGIGGGIFGKVMADENVGANANQLPKNEHHEEVVRENNAQHGE